MIIGRGGAGDRGDVIRRWHQTVPAGSRLRPPDYFISGEYKKMKNSPKQGFTSSRSGSKSRLFAKSVLLTTLAASATGCSVFYNEARDKQGQTAKSDWEKVDLTSQISLARKNHAALLAEQLKTTDERAVILRNIAAREMAIGSGSVNDVLLKSIERELHKLSASDSAAQSWVQYETTKQGAEAGVALAVQNFKQSGFTPKRCDEAQLNEAPIGEIRDADAVKGRRLTEIQQDYVAKCAALKDIGPKPTLPDGMLAAAVEARDTASAEVDKADDDTKPARDAFEAALAEFNKATSAQEANSKGLQEKLQHAKEKLQSAVENADKAGEVLSGAFGSQLLSDAEQASIDRFLATLTATKDDTLAERSKAADAILAISKFAAETKADWAATDKPNLVPLLLAKNLAQAKGDAAAREIALRRLKLDLLQQRVNIQLQRYQRLSYAKAALVGKPEVRRGREIDTAALPPINLEEPVNAGFTPVGARPAKTKELNAWKAQVIDKQRLWDSATNYLDDVGRLQPAAAKINFQVDALAHDRSLSLAESNLALWTGVINSVVEQQASYAASGIKPSDIQALLNSATLLWIGKGVN
ncbi:hypothetical protein JOD97_001121 [Duganella sp. 1411]|uniref:hypothetical protein n=1 Tax=Duganella sp. 1411 TaxID=2806572 RepID=UPI001AE2525F|nr:hypothetical protein [Duganella sp. 1411]MBP1203107.1 hypothetical protein [Duganella sp. 1411]